MKVDCFLRSIASQGRPDEKWSLALQALWWAKKGDWNEAHSCAQDAGTPEGDWVHAYLHRVEGDLGNAAYWYDRAGKPLPRISLSEEWEELAKNLAVP